MIQLLHVITNMQLDAMRTLCADIDHSKQQKNNKASLKVRTGD